MQQSLWSHGYYSHSAYTSGYYRELAPNWIDFACLVKGFRPARTAEGDRFRYLDLGCGTGFGLCLLAALYPEGDFIGIDFFPAHIALASHTAATLRINNVKFLRADFLELKEDLVSLTSISGGKLEFDYVVAHGVITWVLDSVQDALLSTAATCLRPGGYFYCSYNCFPGWLARTALHQLVTIERQRSDFAIPMQPITKASATLLSLLGDESCPTTLALSNPGLKDDLELLSSFSPKYLSQEYANDGWQPLYVRQLHDRCLSHKLTFASSANLPELFSQLFPSSLQRILQAEENPGVRELLVDLATNKSFRRDIFTLGGSSLSTSARENRLLNMSVRLQEAPGKANYEFKTTYGVVSGNPEAYKEFESALSDGPKSLGSLLSLKPGSHIDEIVVQVAMLLNANRTGLDRGPAGHQAHSHCLAVNDTIHLLASEGYGYTYFTASFIGQAIRIPLEEQIFAAGKMQGLEGELLVSLGQAALISLGIESPTDSKDIKEEADPETQLTLLTQKCSEFLNDRLPRLQALGAYPSQGPRQ